MAAQNSTLNIAATGSTSQFLNYETYTVNVASTGETGGDGATRRRLQRGTGSGTLTVGDVGSGMTVVYKPIRWYMVPLPSPDSLLTISSQVEGLPSPFSPIAIST